EQMLQRQILVAAATNVVDRALQRGLELGRQHGVLPSVRQSAGSRDPSDSRDFGQVQSVGSIDSCSGNCWAFARAMVLVTLVSAPHTVTPPATPTPLLCTWLMIATASFSFLWNTVWSTHTTNSRVV